jgi:phosphoribosyl-AMP cyclohydrolase
MSNAARPSALDPEIARRLKRDDAGLFPAVAQQHDTGEVLMVGWMDDEALHRTLSTGRCTYWSRSRQEYWVKGDTSGHQQWVKSVSLDCDGDTVLVRVDQVGAACTPATAPASTPAAWRPWWPIAPSQSPRMADPAPAAATPAAAARPRRQFVLMLLLGAAGAGLALLAVRQGWARAVYHEPRPLPSHSITVTGQDLVPAAGALALAGLACLAAIIATRGVLRRAAGAVLALCGVGAVVAASGSLSAARIIAAASSKVSSAASVASGGSGSTTGGTSSGSSAGAVVTGNSSVHTVLLGVPWRVAIFAGAAAIIAAGLLTVWRSARWPVMSGRYERQAGPAGSGHPGRPARPSPVPAARSAQLDQAALWDSISRGDDPTLAPEPTGSTGSTGSTGTTEASGTTGGPTAR